MFDLVISAISGGWASAPAPAWPRRTSRAWQALHAGADDLGEPGNDDIYGAGRVNALGSLQ